MNVCVIGAGYVGLTTATVLSDLGHHVTCVDKDKEKINMLNHGDVPVYEPGLEERIAKNRQLGRLCFSEKIVETIEKCEVVLIAVGTPQAEDSSPDLTAIDAVTDTLVRSISSYKLILVKSTVPPGTNERLEQMLLDKGVKPALFDIVANPEFLREGTAIDDTLHPNKIVVGLKNSKVIDTLHLLYHGINAPYIVTTLAGAEMIKYASNAFLATKVSFVNELARICDAYYVDIDEVTRGLGTDPRIGPHFLNAGLGFGGSCLPKDINALEHAALKKQVIPILLNAVKKINESQINIYVKKLENSLSGLTGKQIAVWGMAFKPNTDDIRFSPAIRLIEQLESKGCLISVYDPLASSIELPALRHQNLYDAVHNADALVIATDWDEFKKADWAKVKNLMRGNMIIDGRNCLNAGQIRSYGLRYSGVARP